MSEQDVLKYSDKLKESVNEMRLFVEAFNQISNLCHRAEIDADELCHITDLFQREHKKLWHSLMHSSFAIDHYLHSSEKAPAVSISSNSSIDGVSGAKVIPIRPN